MAFVFMLQIQQNENENWYKLMIFDEYDAAFQNPYHELFEIANMLKDPNDFYA